MPLFRQTLVSRGIQETGLNQGRLIPSVILLCTRVLFDQKLRKFLNGELRLYVKHD